LVQDALHQEQKQLNQVAARAVQYNILKREVDTNKQLYEGLLQRLKEASVSASLKASNIRIVDAAEPPTNPVTPKIPLNLGVAAIFGLGLGFCAAFLQERLDDTLKGTEDVERLFGLSAVGLIPAVPQLNGNHHSVSKLLEHAKVLNRKENGTGRRPALAWHRIDEERNKTRPWQKRFAVFAHPSCFPPQIIHPVLCWSPARNPERARPPSPPNLSIALAQLGQRVLLVDADLRSPSLHRLFGVRENLGLVNYLTVIRIGIPSCVLGMHGLDLLFCGPIPPIHRNFSRREAWAN